MLDRFRLLNNGVAWILVQYQMFSAELQKSSPFLFVFMFFLDFNVFKHSPVILCSHNFQ